MKTKTAKSNLTVQQNNKLNIPILLSISFILIAFASGILFYPKLPEQVITHWGIEGEANGYSPKTIGIFLMPVLMAGLFVILYFLPKIDPLRKNIELFRNDYNLLIATVIAFLLYIHLASIVLNLGFEYDMRQIISPAFAALIYMTGKVIEKSKRNFFIGIRTPWTISSDKVWEKTHKKAGLLFKISAVLSLIGFFIPNLAFIFIIIPLVFVSFAIIVYSYIEYKKEQAEKAVRKK